MRITKRQEFAIIVGTIVVASGMGLLLVTPQITHFFNDNSSNILQFTLYPNHIVPCNFLYTITAYHTDGTSQKVLTGKQFFYPDVYSVVNPATGKVIDHFTVQPQIQCTQSSVSGFLPWDKNGLHPVVTGSYTLTSTVYQQNHSYLVANQYVDIGKVYLVSGAIQNLGSPVTISGTNMNNLLPKQGFAFSWINQFSTRFYFTIPELQQNSVYEGAIETPMLGLQTKGNSVTPTQNPSAGTTPQFGCGSSNSICTYPLSAGIHYVISYNDGTTQEGNSPNSIAPKLTLNDLFKQDGNSQTPITGIKMTVLVKDTNNLGISVANEKLNIAGTVQVGDRQPLALSSSDFSITPVNDINFGLVTVTVSPNAINQDILNAFGSPAQNPQQTTIHFTVDGTFDANYQGKTYNGVISGLSWSIDTMYGNIGNTGKGSSNAGGSGCALGTASSGSINPNGGSPSSGQSFGCQDLQTYCANNPLDTACINSNNGNNGNSGGNNGGSSGSGGSSNGNNNNNGNAGGNGGVAGACSTSSTSSQCASDLLTQQIQNLIGGPNMLTYFFIGMAMFIIVIVLIKKSSG